MKSTKVRSGSQNLANTPGNKGIQHSRLQNQLRWFHLKTTSLCADSRETGSTTEIPNWQTDTHTLCYYHCPDGPTCTQLLKIPTEQQSKSYCAQHYITIFTSIWRAFDHNELLLKGINPRDVNNVTTALFHNTVLQSSELRLQSKWRLREKGKW